MMLQPAVLALLSASLLVSLMTVGAGWLGLQILRHWDPRSGSERQLLLERRTYLVSTLLRFCFLLQALSLFYFIYTADSLHSRFAGAMCAVGTLNVDPYGYPVLLVKIVTFLLAGVWLIINHTDNLAYDYPLIRPKYLLLLVIAPLVVVEAGLQLAYFAGLRTDVVASCCGNLFSAAASSLPGEMAALPGRPLMAALAVAVLLTVASGIVFYRCRRWGLVFSLASVATFPLAILALISVFCLYFYQLPTHHCPFCLLQREYGYIGYLLYLALGTGAVAGAGTGSLLPAARLPSLRAIVPRQQRRLVVVTIIAYLLFIALVLGRMALTDFHMDHW